MILSITMQVKHPNFDVAPPLQRKYKTVYSKHPLSAESGLSQLLLGLQSEEESDLPHLEQGQHRAHLGGGPCRSIPKLGIAWLQHSQKCICSGTGYVKKYK